MLFTDSLKKNNDFVRVYKNGRYFVSKNLILYLLSGGSPGYNALGVTASKKVGKSVRRNRVRRLIKENYRHFEQFIRAGFLIVFVVRARRDDCIPGYCDISREMKGLFLRAGVFDQKKWEISQNGA